MPSHLPLFHPGSQNSNLSPLSCFVLFFYVLFLRERERERERESKPGEGQRERERQGDPESEAGSGLQAVSTEPDEGLEPMNREIMT